MGCKKGELVLGQIISQFSSGNPFPSPLEAGSYRHCEGVKRPKQSHFSSKRDEIAALPTVARNDKLQLRPNPSDGGREFPDENYLIYPPKKRIPPYFNIAERSLS